MKTDNKEIDRIKLKLEATPLKEKGSLICSLILEGRVEHRRAIYEFVSSYQNKKGLIIQILRAQGQLWGWFREEVAGVIQEMVPLLKDAILELLYTTQGTDLHLILQLVRDSKDPVFLEPLLNILKRGDYWSRFIAIDALSKIGGDKAVNALIEALDDRELRWSAITGLADMKVVNSLKMVLKCLADPDEEIRLEVLRAVESFGHKGVMGIMAKIATADPSAKVREKALLVYQSLARMHSIDVSEEVKRLATKVIRAVNEIDPILARAKVANASDVHIVPGATIGFRIHGSFYDFNRDVLSAKDTEELLLPIIPGHLKQEFNTYLQVDFAYEVPGVGRFRVNIFRERRGIAGVFRIIPRDVPPIKTLGLPKIVSDVQYMQQGMVIVTGRSGSGKTTTLAAITQMINESRAAHIITLEDPVEYMFERKKSLITQREIGRDTVSFASALKAALREDPDVIVVGEMRDVESMRLALIAAETGHLVLTTLHTPTAAETINRLIQSFPGSEQSQVRLMLADSLRLIVAQNLVRRVDGKGRVGVFETLVVNAAVANLIKEHKEAQIPALMQAGRHIGMKLMDDALYDLWERGIISTEDAILRAIDKNRFKTGG